MPSHKPLFNNSARIGIDPSDSYYTQVEYITKKHYTLNKYNQAHNLLIPSQTHHMQKLSKKLQILNQVQFTTKKIHHRQLIHPQGKIWLSPWPCWSRHAPNAAATLPPTTMDTPTPHNFLHCRWFDYMGHKDVEGIEYRRQGMDKTAPATTVTIVTNLLPPNQKLQQTQRKTAIAKGDTEYQRISHITFDRRCILCQEQKHRCHQKIDKSKLHHQEWWWRWGRINRAVGD